MVSKEGFELFVILFYCIPLGLVALYSLTRFYVVEQGFAMVVERFGRFHRVCDAGLHFLIPFVDLPRPMRWRSSEVYSSGNSAQQVKITETIVTKIDLREDTMDFPNQPIITRDNVLLQVHPCLFYRIVDPRRAVYETFDLDNAVEKLVQTTLRSIIGDMGLDDTLASREEIERGLELRIKSICFDWGLEIKSCELLELTPTPSVQDAMHQQLRAERERRAAIVSAEGFRQKEKTESEGDCQAAITLAQGAQQVEVIRARASAAARVELARAEADVVSVMATALRSFDADAAQYVMGTKYIDVFRSLAASSDQRILYFPYEADVLGGLSSVVHAPARA